MNIGRKMTYTEDSINGEPIWHIKWNFGFNDDNKKYLMAGIAVAVSVYSLCGSRAFGVILGIIVAILIAFCKECYDYLKKNIDWDWSDIVWMLVGGFLGGVISTISYALWNG